MSEHRLEGCGGRAFQAAGIVSAKALRQKCLLLQKQPGGQLRLEQSERVCVRAHALTLACTQIIDKVREVTGARSHRVLKTTERAWL